MAIADYLTPHTEPAALPERVLAIVQAREDSSERLIGWLQLALAAVFMTLFALAPRPVDVHMVMLEPVPVALTAYAMFTVLRLALAYRGRLPWWLLVASIVFDATLLMTLIWSFHGQYGQPSAFSLKVPTFVYVFAFIALRALRFDYRYVLLTGLSFVIGWLSLLIAAIQVDGREAITRNFTLYLTSNHIMIGAEFDKILAIVLVTLLLAATVHRAYGMLVQATREEAASRDIRRFLPSEVAEAITRSDQPIEAGDAMAREAAIVMLDIRGFTRVAAVVPAARLVEILTGFHARILPLVKSHNGVVDKFLGDGVMITFGAVKPSRTASADALRCLDDIMREADRWCVDLRAGGGLPPIEVNAAAASGAVVFATLGATGRLEYTVIGEAVNLAAKLEKHNKVEGTRVLTSAATLDRAIAQGYQLRATFRLLRASAVGGVTRPIDLVALG